MASRMMHEEDVLAAVLADMAGMRSSSDDDTVPQTKQMYDAGTTTEDSDGIGMDTAPTLNPTPTPTSSGSGVKSNVTGHTGSIGSSTLT